MCTSKIAYVTLCAVSSKYEVWCIVGLNVIMSTSCQSGEMGKAVLRREHVLKAEEAPLVKLVTFITKLFASVK